MLCSCRTKKKKLVLMPLPHSQAGYSFPSTPFPPHTTLFSHWKQGKYLVLPGIRGHMTSSRFLMFAQHCHIGDRRESSFPCRRPGAYAEFSILASSGWTEHLWDPRRLSISANLCLCNGKAQVCFLLPWPVLWPRDSWSPMLALFNKSLSLCSQCTNGVWYVYEPD